MFKQVVILKVSPWFLYADSESASLSLCEHYKDDVVGIVLGENIIVKKPRMTLTLEQEATFQISYEEPEQKFECDTSIELDIEQASKELEDEFSKLQSSID